MYKPPPINLISFYNKHYNLFLSFHSSTVKSQKHFSKKDLEKNSSSTFKIKSFTNPQCAKKPVHQYQNVSVQLCVVRRANSMVPGLL